MFHVHTTFTERDGEQRTRDTFHNRKDKAMREATCARIITHRCGATDASIRVHQVGDSAERCEPCLQEMTGERA